MVKIVNIFVFSHHLTLISSFNILNAQIFVCIFAKLLELILVFYPSNPTNLKIDILTIHPQLLQSPFEYSILKRAIDKNLVDVKLWDIRKFSTHKQKSVDDYAFGGGAGMVMMIEPIDNCLEEVKKENQPDEVIYLTPDGEVLSQKLANHLSTLNHIVMICGHYKGVDQRVRDNLVTREVSIGDYVLSGGELAAAVLSDAIIRLIPGVLSDETSALTDSFQDDLLAPPVYTRPMEYKGLRVPEVLFCGDHKKIEEWRHQQSIERTKKLRPNLSKE